VSGTLMCGRTKARAPLRKLAGRAKGSSRNVRHEEPIRHTLLEVPDHCRPLPVFAPFCLRSCASRRTARASCTSIRGAGARRFVLVGGRGTSVASGGGGVILSKRL